MIAGTNSGCGKTTIATGIMAALVKRGCKVQPFKVGPDYIDPMFHSFITAKYSRNLDTWMLDEDTVRYLFERSAKDADIAVIEGVMGMYDGFGGDDETGSTAHLSKVVKSPVVLVVDGEGMSLSIAALIQGFVDFDRNVDIKGVIINNINSEAHYQLLKDIIEGNIEVRALGYLPKISGYSLESRHLGLVPSDEVEGLRKKISLLVEQIEKTVELDTLLKMAGESDELLLTGSQLKGFCQGNGHLDYSSSGQSRVKIGVAKDKAFNFYYRDNLELLEMLGAELVFFSPVNDNNLPKDIDGIYIGGGYPEVWAKELEKNTSMKSDIREAIMQGIPAYAECGGLIYMSESIRDIEGNVFNMVGVIPGKSEMSSSLKRFGYVDIEVNQDNVLARKGFKVRGHEFHYSLTEVSPDVPACYTVSKQKRDGKTSSWMCGFKSYNLLAGYPHIHFWANTDFAREFVNNCRKWKVKRAGV
ncbi:MAG: cobyrinate a,c-diamide synthase [Acetivibrionales bacterium]